MSRDRDRANAQIRLCRQRKAEGLIGLLVWVHETNLVETFRLAELIAPGQPDPEKAELARLLEHVIQLWIDPPSDR